jgi:hypothetical protein
MNLEEYFLKKECNYWREFEFAYGRLNVKDKVVVVVGADCGSTHVFFLMRGARYVIGYEKEEHLRELWKRVCIDFDVCKKGEMHGEWKKGYPDADILVMDCEGCEKDLDVSSLSKYKEWCIGVHDWTENRVSLLRALQGTTFTYVSDDGREVTLCHIE